MEQSMPANTASRGARNQQVARAGEYFVVAELNKRGAHAVTFAGNMPKIDLLACNHNQSRTVYIQVKTKRGGRAWQASLLAGRPTQPPATPLDETAFWILVDLGGWETTPRYWVVPDWWIRNDIDQAHRAYVARHGGTRARNPASTHHAIEEKRVQEWQEQWKILGLF